MKFSKEVAVGALALTALIILYFGVRFLKGIDTFSRTYTYYTVYQEIDGLKLSNPVILNGYPVGRVSGIGFRQAKELEVVVQLEINKEIVLGKNTVAMLTSPSLLGDKAIRLSGIAEGNPMTEGDTMTGQLEEGMMATYQKKADVLLAGLDTTMANLNQLLVTYDQVGKTAQVTLEQTNNKLTQVDMRDVKATLANLKRMSGDLAKASERMPAISEKMDHLADSLNQAQIASLVNDLRGTMTELETMLQGINQSKGSMGMMMNDKALYQDLDQTIRSLDSLLVDLKENPKRYVHFSVFGKSDKKKEKK